MKQPERLKSILKTPKRMWEVLCLGRYDFMFDFMPLSIRGMSMAKRLNLFRSGRNLVYRKLMPWSKPIHMQIELTNYCNLKCPVCPSGIGKINRKPMAMEVSLFEQLMDEVGPYLLTASLWVWGEPLLHPGLADILRIAQRHPVATLLSTNGQNLDKDEVIKALIDYPPTYLIVAIDGMTDETNSKFRVGAKLGPILSGVRRLAELKKERKQILPILHMRYIIMKHNEHEVPHLKDFAKENGFDLLTLRTLSCIDAPEQDYKSLMPDNNDFKAYNYLNDKRVRHSNFVCTEPFWFPSMFADGTITACCHDYNAEHPFGLLSKKISFFDIWGSKKAAEVRSIIRDSNANVNFCRYCPYTDRQTGDGSIQAFILNEESCRAVPPQFVQNPQCHKGPARNGKPLR
jgi:MoaA/NifB/PqqE/SkfB family radical SAM enzyme